MHTIIKARCTDRSTRSEAREFKNDFIGQKALLYGALIIAPIMSIFLMKLSKIKDYAEDFMFFNVGLTISLAILISIIGLVFKYYKTAKYKMNVLAFLSIVYWFSILKFEIFHSFFNVMNHFQILNIAFALPTSIILILILWAVFFTSFILLDNYLGHNDSYLLKKIFGKCNIRLLYIVILLGSLFPLFIILMFSSDFINTSYMSFLISYFYYLIFVLFSLHENLPEHILLRENRGNY